MQYDYDLLVIGAGSGGVRAARIAASLGARVAVVEDRYLGGTCVNVGCVPKKLFVYASQFSAEIAAAEGFGVQAQWQGFDWPTLRDNKNREIARLNDVYRKLLANAGATLLDGRGKILDPHRVQVGEQVYGAERILIATGGWPVMPEVPGAEHMISSNEVFFLEQFPRHAVVIGAGYIAVEFAGIFSGLGADTHLVCRRDRVLRGFDDDIRNHVQAEMQKKGVQIHRCDAPKSVEKLPNGQLLLTLEDGSQLQTDLILAATGRKPNTQGLGLENTAVQLKANGAIDVDDQYQTAEPSIYAVGDVTGSVQLTPVALAEGMALARRLFGDASVPQRPVDYQNIPTAVFCQPNIGTVGLTEAEARLNHEQIDIYRSSFRAMKHSFGGSDERTLMKLIVDRTTDRVLGAHMVGPDAGEIIQGLAIAMKAGASKTDFDTTIGVHPTAAEEFVTMREPLAE